MHTFVQGLNLASKEQMPQANVRYYDWHIYSKFKMKFLGLLLKTYFWQAAKSYNLIDTMRLWRG